MSPREIKIFLTPDGMYSESGQLLAKIRKTTAAERKPLADYFANAIDEMIIEQVLRMGTKKDAGP